MNFLHSMYTCSLKSSTYSRNVSNVLQYAVHRLQGPVMSMLNSISVNNQKKKLYKSKRRVGWDGGGAIRKRMFIRFS